MSRSCAEKGRNRERGSFLFMAIGLEYYFQRGTPAKDGAPCADPQFRTLQVCLNDVPATLWQAEHAVNRLWAGRKGHVQHQQRGRWRRVRSSARRCR
jgi:hypothetical protein